MASPSNLQINPYRGSLLVNTQFNLSKLYMHRLFAGPSPNQEKIIEGNAATQFGETAVNNWAIYDGAGSGAELIARAQGMHMNAGNWYNSFIVVFEGERFKGSTLQVTGASVGDDSDWAIVGGTGMFAMATGVVERKAPQGINGGQAQELTFTGFSRRKTVLTKLGPWGGQGSSANDIQAKPGHLKSVTFVSGTVVDSMSFSYIDKDGKSRTAGRWGGPGGPLVTEIQLGSSEYIKGLSGTIVADFNGRKNVISSLTVVTNEKTYGPFGKGSGTGTAFQVPVPEGSSIEGFYGTTGNFMHSIGVYTIS
uniref:Uncharacterized protein n=1 Tax=Avena sativa TaxID=4498 RepID=A0ACD5Z0V7_AVESA